MKAMVRNVTDGDLRYQALMFCCPGCGGTGLHMLPVNCNAGGKPTWTWDGNLDAPTLSPSILTRWGNDKVCHSYLRAGVFEYLDDSTHQYAGQKVPMPELPEWLIHDGETHEFVPYNADWHMPRCKVCKEFEDHPNHGGAEEAGQ